MVAEFELVAGAGKDHYSIVIGVRDTKELADACKLLDQNIQGPEALIKGLLKAAPGSIISVDRYKDGKLNDGPAGEPAQQRYYADGALLRESRFVQGLLSDNMTYGYADNEYYPNGQLKQQTRANLGRMQDGSGGDPALKVYAEDGKLKMVQRCQHGKLQNSPAGDPAVEIFNTDGTLETAFNAKAGKVVRELTPAQLTELQETRESLAVIRLTAPQLKLKPKSAA